MHDPQENENLFGAAQARHYRQCAKEARIVGLIWLIGLAYCTFVIVRWGYVPPHKRPDDPSLTLGMPTWVFWGLFAPWLVQIGVTFWFALSVIKDDEPLTEAPALSKDQPASIDS